MENSPLTDRSVAEEEESFRGSASRRSLDRELPASRTHSQGASSRVQSWMRVGAVDWGIRIAVVGLVIGGFFAIYVNGVAEGWWHAWGETPTVAATGPTAAPTPAPTVSSEPAMSGGYQIGPDGILVRPAEYAADTYTKPELPEAAKENTERGAEAAAEHYLALFVYAWNTGDTQPLADMSDPSSNFAQGHIANTQEMYTHGWSFGNSATVQEVLRLEAVAEQDGAIPPNTIGVRFLVSASNGTRCKEQSIAVDSAQHSSTITLFMTWKDNRWTELQGSATDYDDE